jgi:hypothetical protein
MLGDLTAERTNVLTGNTRLRFHVSIVNKNLIYHLYSIFKNYVKTEPKIIHRPFNRLIQKSHDAISFSTLKYHLFNWVRDDFYKKIDSKYIKIVPKNSYENLTEIGLAFWIMDDGSYNKIKQNLILCTDSYSKEDVLFLIEILKNKFGLSCGIINYKKTKDGRDSYRIRINKSSIPKLIKLTEGYFIKSMLYKLGL